MYKNEILTLFPALGITGFNPCFNGSMYKNRDEVYNDNTDFRFNPCFNGSMYKNTV